MPTFQAKEAARIQKARKTERPQEAAAGVAGPVGSGGSESVAEESPRYVFLWLGGGILAATVLTIAAWLGLRIRRSGLSRRSDLRNPAPW